MRATALGLALQPLYVPMLMRAYVADGVRRTNDDGLWRRTESAAMAFDDLFGTDAGRVAFLFRVGAEPGNRTARSVRRPLKDFLEPPVMAAALASGVSPKSAVTPSAHRR